MSKHSYLYQNAVYYDIALGRDVSLEADFLCALFRRYTGSELRSVVDLACGPGYHALEFARRGLEATGLDLRPEMVELARHKAGEAGLSVSWLVGDMRDFRLERPVNLAICMLDGIDNLVTNDDILRNFQSVAANLTAGGLYVVDYTHLRDCSYQNYGSYCYAGRRDGISVKIVWATNKPSFDIVTGVAQVEMEMHVDDNGRRKIVKAQAQERLPSPQEIILLARLSGVLEVAGWHGDYDVEQSLDNSPASQRIIAVLRKAG